MQVQALVDRTGGNPRRVCTGFDGQRLAMLLAVMNRHLGCQLGGYAVFVNVVGGLRLGEPAADLAIACAVWSSLSGVAVPHDVVVFGELGLGGFVFGGERFDLGLLVVGLLLGDRAFAAKTFDPLPRALGLLETRQAAADFGGGLLAFLGVGAGFELCEL